MEHFREVLLRELDIRGRRPKTKTAYLASLEKFTDFYKKPLNDLGIDDMKLFQYHLIKEEQLNPRTVNRHLSAVRFFYTIILDRNLRPGQVPQMKTRDKLPIIFSTEEIKQMLSAIKDIQHHAIFATLYSTGMRLGEIQRLRPRDINSKRMVIEIIDGKGGVDRLAILSPYLLKILRQYWVESKNDKSCWLFSPTRNSFSKKHLNKPLSHTAVDYVVKRAAILAGIDKRITVHSLRYAFAMHLLEKNTNLRHIQYLLGHKDIRTTVRYLRCSDIKTIEVASPLDDLMVEAS